MFGLTRRFERSRDLWALGAISVVVDVFDAPILVLVFCAVKPDAVIHQLTDLATMLLGVAAALVPLHVSSPFMTASDREIKVGVLRACDYAWVWPANTSVMPAKPSQACDSSP